MRAAATAAASMVPAWMALSAWWAPSFWSPGAVGGLAFSWLLLYAASVAAAADGEPAFLAWAVCAAMAGVFTAANGAYAVLALLESTALPEPLLLAAAVVASGDLAAYFAANQM
jgi:hypothetical protein